MPAAPHLQCLQQVSRKTAILLLTKRNLIVQHHNHCNAAFLFIFLGRQMDDFSLQDFRGSRHTLAELEDRKLVVLYFLGTECPLAKLYGSRVQKLADEFGPQDVAVLGISSNVQDSLSELASHARLHKLTFPILKDLQAALAGVGAQAYGAAGGSTDGWATVSSAFQRERDLRRAASGAVRSALPPLNP